MAGEHADELAQDRAGQEVAGRRGSDDLSGQALLAGDDRRPEGVVVVRDDHDPLAALLGSQELQAEEQVLVGAGRGGLAAQQVGIGAGPDEVVGHGDGLRHVLPRALPSGADEDGVAATCELGIEHLPTTGEPGGEQRRDPGAEDAGAQHDDRVGPRRRVPPGVEQSVEDEGPEEQPEVGQEHPDGAHHHDDAHPSADDRQGGQHREGDDGDAEQQGQHVAEAAPLPPGHRESVEDEEGDLGDGAEEEHDEDRARGQHAGRHRVQERQDGQVHHCRPRGHGEPESAQLGHRGPALGIGERRAGHTRVDDPDARRHPGQPAMVTEGGDDQTGDAQDRRGAGEERGAGHGAEHLEDEIAPGPGGRAHQASGGGRGLAGLPLRPEHDQALTHRRATAGEGHHDEQHEGDGQA